jgi:hypothetical protein
MAILGDQMQAQWSERAIRGAKCLTAGATGVLAHDAAAAHAHGNPLALLMVNLLLGVVAPSVALYGLYLVGTRHKSGK